MAKVYEKLNKVQQELKAPKGQYNSFGKYPYRSCEDILEGIKPLLSEVSAVLIISDELLKIGERYYIKAIAKFIDCESGESVENNAYAREEELKKGMDSSQVTGSTSSYARKYALNGLLCIDDVKDADTQDNSNKNTNSKANNTSINPNNTPANTNTDPLIDKPKITVIEKELDRTGFELNNLLKAYGISRLEEMKTSQFTDAMSRFKKTANKK